jgi:hypothetical protein
MGGEMRYLTLGLMAAAASLGLVTGASAAAINFQIGYQLLVDCDQPQKVQNVPVRGEGTGVLNSDRTGSVDMTITALTSNTIHFDGKLGGRKSPAPGGTASIRILSGNRLQTIWELPTNKVIGTVAITGQGCTSTVDFKLKGGNTQYSLFDGQQFFFCSKPRLVSSDCALK